MHVPQVVRSKIWQHQFINLSVLLKGNAEIENLTQGGLIRLNDQGLLETYSKPFNEKLNTISRWTDAFLIFSSIYLLKFPQSGGELMQYMTTVREASQIYGGFAWRVYDGKFRLRVQEYGLKSWDIYYPLYVKTMRTVSVQPGQIGQPSHSDNVKARSYTCFDFNNGPNLCRYNPCRYPHKCSECSGSCHGLYDCPTLNQTQMQTTTTYSPSNSSFRGSDRF